MKEIEFYEKIGVKHWKKFVIWLEAKLIPDPEYRNVLNYNLKSKNLESVKRFKKMLILNCAIHFIMGVYTLLCVFITICNNNIMSFQMLIYVICFLVNLYCVLLQRYNWIRIKKVLKKKETLDKKITVQ